jgi:hypothetical protein
MRLLLAAGSFHLDDADARLIWFHCILRILLFRSA